MPTSPDTNATGRTSAGTKSASTKKLTTEEILKVANLARLKLSDDEATQMTQQMAAILQYVDILGEVPTDGVEPMAHVNDTVNRLRDDEVQASLLREAALANAPQTDGRCFLVPQILDGA